MWTNTKNVIKFAYNPMARVLIESDQAMRYEQNQ